MTLATYVFFIFTVIGRQKLDGIGIGEKPERMQSGRLPMSIDLYIPVYTVLQFFFYMGLLKVRMKTRCWIMKIRHKSKFEPLSLWTMSLISILSSIPFYALISLSSTMTSRHFHFFYMYKWIINLIINFEGTFFVYLLLFFFLYHCMKNLYSGEFVFYCNYCFLTLLLCLA